MAGSVFGKLFRVSTWGESHGKAVGVVIDGCPAGVELCEEDIQQMLDRRKPGQSRFTTQRTEDDAVEILSGIFEGKTTGTPISMIVYNKTQRSADYSEIASYYRPGHADYTFDMKYGFRDYRGGGRSSGRETIARVAAGAVAMKILEHMSVKICAYSKSIGNICVNEQNINLLERFNNPFVMPDADGAKRVEEFALEKMAQKDSVGGVIECVVDNLMPGLGETVFDKLDANLAKAMFSIGAVKGFEIGAGFKAAHMSGSENNDEFCYDDGIFKKTNNAGGVLGGMSDGSQLVFRAAIKPTPSIASLQHTVNKNNENVEISIKGRHDPMIVPRAVVVVEAMAALVIVDLLLENMTARIDKIAEFYKN